MPTEETQDLPQRTAQEVQDILEARKRYKATPEGKKAGAAFAASIAKTKAEQKDKAKRQAQRDARASQGIDAASEELEEEEERRAKDAKIVEVSFARIEAEHKASKAEAKAEAQTKRADQADADRYERHQQTFKTWEESDLDKAPDDFVYTVEIFLKAFDVPDRNRKTVTDALTNWAKCCSKRPNRAPRQRWELDKEQAKLFYENYIGKGRHQKRHALRAENK